MEVDAWELQEILNAAMKKGEFLWPNTMLSNQVQLWSSKCFMKFNN